MVAAGLCDMATSALDAIVNSDTKRLSSYRDAIVRTGSKTFIPEGKPKDDAKDELLVELSEGEL